MADVLNTGANLDPTVKAPEGHDAAMAAKMDELEANGGNQPTTTESGSDELLLGKFKTTEDLAKAYQELERKLSSGGQKETSEGSENNSLEIDPKEASQEQVKEVVDKAGLDMAEITEFYNQNGSLSDEHYQKLEESGIPREMVDQYIAGQEARAEQMRNDIFNELGGEENFKSMSQWAQANLSREVLEKYNADVSSGDFNTVRNAVMALAYQYEKAQGSEPNLVSGDKAATGPAFESLDQLTRAMQDPRYETDPAYRREVEQKLARSNIL